jgi:hypothetical protein
MRAVLIFILFAVSACNQVHEANPQPASVPENVINLVESRYQGAGSMVFIELIRGRVWNVDFQSAGTRYSTALNPENILVSYRMAASGVPDSLAGMLNATVLQGGEFSNFKELDYTWVNEGNYGKSFLADYQWQGQNYLFRWGVTYISGQNTYNLEMDPAKNRFTTLEVMDLPESIRDYISGKGLEFSRATILVNANREKTYRIQLLKNGSFFELVFNDQLNLIAGSDQLTVLGSAGELPLSIQNYLAAGPEYAGFVFSGQFSHIFKREFDGVISYEIGIQKHSGTLAGSQAWFITFDQNGNPVSRNYLGLY